MFKNKKIYIAGHNGMLGSAIHRTLIKKGYKNLILVNKNELNLTDPIAVDTFFNNYKPEIVIFTAALVGGIGANLEKPVNFLEENLRIQLNVISSAYKSGVIKFIFIGSSCIYPKNCPQPIKENYLMTGPLEPTNEGYALAKITGIKLLQYYKAQYNFNSISLMPCNLYGPNDSFDLKKSHVLSALIKKFVDAKHNKLNEVILWGTGEAYREFMHVDDAASAIEYFMVNYNDNKILNIGTGSEISILELSKLISKIVGYTGNIIWDNTKPNGMLKKCLDVSQMKKLGFEPKIKLENGILEMINIYKKTI